MTKGNGYLRRVEFEAWAAGLGQRLDRIDGSMATVTSIVQQHAADLAVFKDRGETTKSERTVHRTVLLSTLGSLLVAITATILAALAHFRH